MTATTSLHATSVAIGGRAVLLTGASGAGKSDLALRLIDRGATLVSDDYTIVTADGAALVADAPATIAGRIEIRGVGIVSRPFAGRVPVALIVDLDRPARRMPEPALSQICGIVIPTIGLHGLEPSAPIKVEAALLLHGLAASCSL